MLSFALYDEKHDECQQLSSSVRENMAFLSDEELRLNTSEESAEFRDIMASGSIFDMGCLDITGEGGVSLAEDFRRVHDNSMLMLIADASMSPMDYIRPSIVAAGLMLRPCDKDMAHRTIRDFMKKYIDSHSKPTSSEFVIETRDDIVRIPYDKIYYIEAKDKKVFIRVQFEEYGYYNTLDNLIEELPDNFVRCHRGYIVNTDKIRKLINTENLLELEADLLIPVSRSLKKSLKETIK